MPYPNHCQQLILKNKNMSPVPVFRGRERQTGQPKRFAFCCHNAGKFNQQIIHIECKWFQQIQRNRIYYNWL